MPVRTRWLSSALFSSPKPEAARFRSSWRSLSSTGRGDVDGVNYDGMAPDARYVDARVLDSSNSFTTIGQVVSGVQFALANQSNIINLSLATFSTESNGLSQLDLLVDYLVDTRRAGHRIGWQ